MLYIINGEKVFHRWNGKRAECGEGGTGYKIGASELLKCRPLKSCKECFGTTEMVLAVSLAWSDGSHPSLMTLHNGILHWSWYTTNVGKYNPEYHNIEHVYGLVDLNDEDDQERVEIEHVNRYPPEMGYSPNGWLLPDGSFWPTSERNHYSEGEYIYMYLYQKRAEYGKYVNFGDYIERGLGWVKISKDFVYTESPLTYAQVNTLSSLMIKSDNNEFKNWVRFLIEEAEDEQSTRTY